MFICCIRQQIIISARVVAQNLALVIILGHMKNCGKTGSKTARSGWVSTFQNRRGGTHPIIRLFWLIKNFPERKAPVKENEANKPVRKLRNSVMLSASLINALDAQAEREGSESRASIIRRACAEYLQKHGAKDSEYS